MTQISCLISYIIYQHIFPQIYVARYHSKITITSVIESLKVSSLKDFTLSLQYFPDQVTRKRVYFLGNQFAYTFLSLIQTIQVFQTDETRTISSASNKTLVRIDAIYYSFLDEHQEARFVSVIIRNSDIRGHPNFAREIDIIEIFPVFSRRIDPTLRFALLSIFTLFLFLFFREAFTRRFFLANTSPWCGVKL